MSKILTEAAKWVCGKQPKRLANPWTIGHERELEALHTDITKWAEQRNLAMEDKAKHRAKTWKKINKTQTRHEKKLKNWKETYDVILTKIV